MKALALISGGLDSMLAAKLVQMQGIEVIGLKFVIPFEINKKRELPKLGIEIREIDIGLEFIDLLKKPKHGYGSNINPCIDCKILMLKKAGKLMQELKADFIVTGEVLGQRPMSQNKQILSTVVKESGLEGFVLRPLSAGLLSKTVPEEKGWINQEALLSISGRERSGQMKLAEAFGITNYAQPAGGCLLTDPEFSRRVKDLLFYKQLDLDNAKVLKIGRHFRLSPDSKLIVGRNQEENNRLAELARDSDFLFEPQEDVAGPVALGRGLFDNDLIAFSCSVVCRYCDSCKGRTIDIIFRQLPNKETKVLQAYPIEDAILISYRI